MHRECELFISCWNNGGEEMSKKIISTSKITGAKKKRFLKAEVSMRKMQEEIAPFIKHKRFKEYSTAGEWCETSSLNS